MVELKCYYLENVEAHLEQVKFIEIVVDHMYHIIEYLEKMIDDLYQEVQEPITILIKLQLKVGGKLKMFLVI